MCGIFGDGGGCGCGYRTFFVILFFYCMCQRAFVSDCRVGPEEGGSVCLGFGFVAWLKVDGFL